MIESKQPLKMGMVGGGQDAFIGAVHRAAAALDGQIVFVAGALSGTPEKAVASGVALGLAHDRSYPSWEAMLTSELARDEADRIDFVSIVTPNHLHYPVAAAFVDAGFNVVCDKPMTLTSQEAADLSARVRAAGTIFCVTYNYAGYPMVKQARHLVHSGALGIVRKVIVEYNQGWLATELESTGQKQADWRTDPERAGAGGAIGDIGTHAEQLVSNVTGLKIESLLADLTSFIKGRRLDDDANVLLRFEGGARGMLTASQVCVGALNDLRLRVWGSKGGLEWHQEDPNTLTVSTLDEPDMTYHRGGPGLCEDALAASRLPAGHPEAFIEAFANVYLSMADAIRAGHDDGQAFGYPDVDQGHRGMQFIEAVVASSQAGGIWVSP
jgi:predicted dehydrogenase